MSENLRVQLDLPPHSAARLKRLVQQARLKETTETPIYAEIFKNALRLYEALLEMNQRGVKFYTEEPGGSPIPLKMFELASPEKPD